MDSNIVLDGMRTGTLQDTPSEYSSDTKLLAGLIHLTPVAAPDSTSLPRRLSGAMVHLTILLMTSLPRPCQAGRVFLSSGDL